MEFLKDMDEKGQAIRQDEINGKQHQFHSLPKEFQAWHNTQYMMEKKVFIDESTIPESLLNGYMWKAIGDGSNFGITTFFAIAFSIIKLKLAPNFWGLFIALIVFMPWLAYVVYHIIFYAKIRAQVVGKVTTNGYKYTSKIYYETFYSIVISLCIALLFIFSILDDIVVVLRDMIVSLNPESIYEGYLKTFLIWIYNFFIDLLSEPKDLFGKILFNTYFSTFIFLGLTLFIPYVFEKQVYNERRKIVDQEIENEEAMSGYPIENAIRKLTEWREKNNV
jgi:hypothetical protein